MSADERSEPEENGRVSPVKDVDLAAASVRPVASFDFIQAVKDAVGRYVDAKQRPTCGQVAAKLNREGIANAQGGDWTSITVKIFDNHYSKSRLRFYPNSN
jgi:hypothetical protein